MASAQAYVSGLDCQNRPHRVTDANVGWGLPRLIDDALSLTRRGILNARAEIQQQELSPLGIAPRPTNRASDGFLQVADPLLRLHTAGWLQIACQIYITQWAARIAAGPARKPRCDLTGGAVGA